MLYGKICALAHAQLGNKLQDEGTMQQRLYNYFGAQEINDHYRIVAHAQQRARARIIVATGGRGLPKIRTVILKDARFRSRSFPPYVSICNCTTAHNNAHARVVPTGGRGLPHVRFRTRSVPPLHNYYSCATITPLTTGSVIKKLVAMFKCRIALLCLLCSSQQALAGGTYAGR